MADKNDVPKKTKPPENLTAKQQAVRLKAFRHIFTKRDFKGELGEKKISQKLLQSKMLERSYVNYLKELEKNPTKKMIFPWDSYFKQLLFWLQVMIPRLLKWCGIAAFCLLIINYIPGPTQHIVEILGARAIYSTANIKRLPETLESYAHSARIVDLAGNIIKSYGKRQVTRQVPEKAKNALLACEDRYFMHNPNYPWYVNQFLVHSGVSWINLFGAINDTLHGNKRGASTLVMQNAKKILGNEERTVSNKIEEIILSLVLVSKFGKEQNLLFYVNTVPVGRNIYGFPAAAHYFYRKELDALNYQQLLTIATVIPNHNRLLAFYEITRGKNFSDLSDTQLFHTRQAMDKYNQGLGHLLAINEITLAEHDGWRLSDEDSIRKIGLRAFQSPLYGEEEWTSWNVIKEVTSRSYYVDNRLISGTQLILDEKGDVVVETGVDLAVSEEIKKTINDFLDSETFQRILREKNRTSWLDDMERYKKQMSTPPFHDFDSFMDYLNRHINVGVLIINQQGEIISYVGGKEFLNDNGKNGKHDDDDSDAAVSNQKVIIDLMNKKAKIFPSSTMKPILAYYAMTTDKANLDTMLADEPLEHKYVEAEDREIWLPRNWYKYDDPGTGYNRYLGRKYSLFDAQLLSVNTIFARLSTDRTIKNALLAGFDRIGLDYNHEDAKYWPFGIGSSLVPVQQWLGVYNAFIDGYYREPRFVKRILVNDKVVYDRQSDQELQPTLLFDANKEREDEMLVLYEVCTRGTAHAIKNDFKYFKNLVSGKTGTAPSEQSALFVSHFNPYNDRTANADKNLTMVVAITTNTGGFKKVGGASQGPVQLSGKIYNWLFEREIKQMIAQEIDLAKKNNSHFRNNHVYWANVNRYMDILLNDTYGKNHIYENIIGVDGYREALRQILNSSTKIYTGRDDLFYQLVGYYCDQEKIVKMPATSAPTSTVPTISTQGKIKSAVDNGAD